jgi:hypothetical protein
MKQAWKCMYTVPWNSVHVTMVAVGKQLSITYSDCAFVALGIQHEMRMRQTVFCGLADSTKCFHIISEKTRFSKTFIEHKMRVFISPQFLSEILLILGRTERDMMKYVNYLLHLSDFN